VVPNGRLARMAMARWRERSSDESDLGLRRAARHDLQNCKIESVKGRSRDAIAAADYTGDGLAVVAEVADENV
jgi:hypothetical protein